MRRKPRLDATHKPIVEALRKLPSVTVQSLAALGGGVPDLLVSIVRKSGPHAVVVEIKTEDGALTDDQVKWRCWWTGPYVIFRSVEDATKWYQQEKRK